MSRSPNVGTTDGPVRASHAHPLECGQSTAPCGITRLRRRGDPSGLPRLSRSHTTPMPAQAALWQPARGRRMLSLETCSQAHETREMPSADHQRYLPEPTAAHTVASQKTMTRPGATRFRLLQVRLRTNRSNTLIRWQNRTTRPARPSSWHPVCAPAPMVPRRRGHHPVKARRQCLARSCLHVWRKRRAPHEACPFHVARRQGAGDPSETSPAHHTAAPRPDRPPRRS